MALKNKIRLHTDKIFTGNLDNLPMPASLAIRVFFSSTFTDMTEERNMLMNNAIPELRKYCNEKGFDFEVVDMRWGVREDAYADHMTTDICLKEIKNCQLTSAGPNFVLFLGDKYGTRPLPNSVPVTEFRMFRRLASWMDLKFDVVEKWYLLDTNSVPAVYHIQPITTLLPFFKDMDPLNEKKRIAHQQSWETDEKHIRKVLQTVASLALEQNKITEEECQKYFVSVTQNEIEKGIFASPKIKDRVICFVRNFNDINIEDTMAKRFTDLTAEGDIDAEAKVLRSRLQNETLPVSVPASQSVQFNVAWTPKGIDVEYEEHKFYLNRLLDSFQTLMKEQIDNCAQEALEQRIEDEVLAEVLVHLQFCLSKCKCFYGQEELIQTLYTMMQVDFSTGKGEAQPLLDDSETNGIVQNDIVKEEEVTVNEEVEVTDNTTSQEENRNVQDLNQPLKDKGITVGIGDVEFDTGSDPNRDVKKELTHYVATDSVKYPIVVYGESGCGKTSLMAQLVKQVKAQIPHSVVIVRFLGTTAKSANIRAMLISVIQNIWAAYKLPRPSDMDFHADVIFLGQYLQALIWQVASSSRPLFIFLDSLDQLSQVEQAHRLAWLPTVLPVHCSLVLSTLPEENGCLDSARRLLARPELFIQVPSLKVESASCVINEVCSQNSRTLTQEQRKFLKEKFAQCPSPLYLKLILDESLSWQSHELVKNLNIAPDTQSAIHQLMMKLEKEYGKVFVSKAFGYLTAMKQGASVMEMEDILSLDDEILQDTYIYHLPPSSQLIRLPPSLWARIMMDIREYTSGEDVGGRLVLTWYHRLFKKVAEDRYLHKDIRHSLHSLCAQYFLGYWHNKHKPLKLYKGKHGWYPDNHRGAPEQSLMFSDGVYNIRKLRELPHHLSLAGMWREFHKEITTSIDWLVAKVKVLGVSELKADLLFMLEQMLSAKDDSGKENVNWKVNDGIVIEELQNGVVATDAETGEYNAKSQTEKEVDLSTCVKELKTLIDIITLGVDCIRHGAHNLPVQICCQLGKTRAKSPGLVKLVTDAFMWMEENNVPLLMPVDACMPEPGGMLETNFNVDVHLLGEDRAHDFPVTYCCADNYLYIIQQNNRQKDTMVVLDLSKGGEKVISEDLYRFVHKVQCNGTEKYLVVCAYTTLSKYEPKFEYLLYERVRLSPFKTERAASCMDVTQKGNLVAYSNDSTCYICTPNNEELTLKTLFSLPHEETIYHIMFSPDGLYLVTFGSGDAFQVWRTQNGELILKAEERKSSARFSFRTPTKFALITSKNKLIQVRSDYNERNTLGVYDLLTGNLLQDLKTPELNYSINLLELDVSEELVLVSSDEDVISNGNMSKSAVLWNIETGNTMSIVASASPISATKIIQVSGALYVLVACKRNSFIGVYLVGSRHMLEPVAKLVQNIYGHSKDILQIILPCDKKTSGEKIISVSADNSIKIWNLKQAISPPPPSNTVDTGAAVNLIYNKTGGEVYFSTEKGFIMKYCTSSELTQTLATDLGRPVDVMILTKNGQYLVAAVKGLIHVYNLETGEKHLQLQPCAKTVSCMAENNMILIAGHSGMEGKGRIWDLSTGAVIRDLTFLYSFFRTAVTSDGKKVGLTFFDFPLAMNVVDAGEGESNISMDQMDTMMSACSHLQFSPDNKMLISASGDARVRVVDSESGRYLHTMIQRSSITTMLVTSDSRQLLTAGYRSVYLWNLGPDHPPEHRGQLVVKLTHHRNFITCMQFAQDEKYLVTASLDKTISLCSMNTRSSICTFRYHCSIDVMQVAPDLSTIAFIPERSPNIAVLVLNKVGQVALHGTSSTSIPDAVQKAQALALSFSSQQVAQRTSASCTVL